MNARLVCNRAFGCAFPACTAARTELVNAISAIAAPATPVIDPPRPPSSAPPRFSLPVAIPEDAQLVTPAENRPVTTIRVFSADDLPILDRPATDDNLNALGSVHSEEITHTSWDTTNAIALEDENDWYSPWCIVGDVLVTDRATQLFDVTTVHSNRSDSSWVHS